MKRSISKLRPNLSSISKVWPVMRCFRASVVRESPAKNVSSAWIRILLASAELNLPSSRSLSALTKRFARRGAGEGSRLTHFCRCLHSHARQGDTRFAGWVLDDIGAPIQDELGLSSVPAGNHLVDMIEDDRAIARCRRDPPAEPKVQVALRSPMLFGQY